MKQDQRETVENVCRHFKEMQGLGEDCIMILVGSFATGQVDSYSDMDVIVVDNVANKMWGEKDVNGIRVNFQIYSKQRLLAEMTIPNKVLCSMLSHSVLVSGSEEDYKRIKALTEAAIARVSTTVPVERRFLMLKKLKNILDDMESMSSDISSLLLLKHELVDYSFHIFLVDHQCIQTNTRNRLKQARSLDKEFVSLVESLLFADPGTLLQAAQDLCGYFADWNKVTESVDWIMTEQILPRRRELELKSPVFNKLRS